MYSGRSVIIIILLLLFTAIQGEAQYDVSEPLYRITYLTSDDGLSQNTVDCILKDSRGFMWFGTWNGLNRYDGYSFKVYKHEGKANDVSNNFIYSICEDSTGNLWIGTRNGLNLLEFKTDRFISFFNDSLDPASISGNWINTVSCDPEGTIWVGTNGNGLNRIVPGTVRDKYIFKHFNAHSVSSFRLPGNTINSIYYDSKDRFWVGTGNGLTLYSKLHDTSFVFTNIPYDDNSLTSDEIRCVYEDRTGTIWIGTIFGLNRWMEGTNRFVRYFNSIDDPYSLSHSNINQIAEDPEGRLYIATLGGLDYYDRERDGFHHLPVYELENLSLNNEFINSLLCDESGLVWVGTEKGGINRFNIYQKQFGYYSAESGRKLKLNHNTVNSILEEDHLLWVGTAGGGLNLINRKTGKEKYFTFNPRADNSLSNDFVTSLCRDRNNNLWVGTWGGGFSKLISTNGDGIFRHYQNDAGDEKSLINNFVSTIYEDDEGKIWIGTEGGLDLFNPNDNRITHVLNQPVSGDQLSEVGCILRDHHGNLWIGTRNGLYYISDEHVALIKKFPNKIPFICFRSDPNNAASLNENYVISLYEDNNKNLWIGTYGNGLNRLDWDGINPGDIKFTHYTQKEGLCNNVVYGILEDNHYNLWLSTDYGLSRFHIESEEFSNYYVADGLQSNQFYWSAAAHGANEILYFGGMKGINYFNPENIVNNQNPPTPILIDFKILNNVVEPGKPFGKRIILDKLISETEEIHLNYRENTFSLEFSGLSYHLPEKNRYAYKLEGVDEDWVKVSSSRRFANYTKLPGGEYIFRLKAANNDGLWNENAATLKIIIKPPFWKTGWFRILIVAVMMLLIGIYLRLHTRSLKLQKRKLEELVRERTAQIEDQKVRLEQQNTEIMEQRDRLIQLNKKVKAVNQLKLKFFTNISHEFKTPLTLMLGPLEKLRGRWKSENDSMKQINLITRNAERLLHLINQLMDFRKIEKGKMSLHVQEGNLGTFIKGILEAFNDLVIQKNIDLVFDCSISDKLVWFDHEKLENVLFNLLSNAFKYTPEKGTINVRVKFINPVRSDVSQGADKKKDANTHVHIEIADTGVGISKDKLPNIFKRFYQAEQINDSTMGSGIGLSLTRDLIKVHRGSIAVDSKPGEGTTFTIQMPCSREAFSEEEVTQTNLGQSNLKSHVNMLKHILENQLSINEDLPVLKLEQYVGKPLLLVVEDNRELREFVASRLNQQFNILIAENGEIAFELAEKHNPDLVISDIMMPVMNGLQLCSMLKEKIETSHIPVILLTAKGTVENQIEGYKTGADEYIPKPFNMELLETRVQNLIDSRKRLRKAFANPDQVSLEEITKNPTDQKFLRKALQHIEKNLDNTEFNVNDFASVMCISRSLLHKKLTALTDQSATDFINTIRLKKARELILSGSYNISEVAYTVGYNDPKYFSRLFKKHFNVSPSEYIKELRTKVG